MAGRWQDRIRQWARVIRRDLAALWLAARDRRVPVAAKVLAGLVVAYAASPIDLIPDFIPVLGLLDDAVIVPLGILAAVRLVPASLMAEFRARADSAAPRPRSMVAAAIIVASSIALAAGAWFVLGRLAAIP